MSIISFEKALKKGKERRIKALEKELDDLLDLIIDSKGKDTLAIQRANEIELELRELYLFGEL